jgi:hypothetical protein
MRQQLLSLDSSLCGNDELRVTGKMPALQNSGFPLPLE